MIFHFPVSPLRYRAKGLVEVGEVVRSCLRGISRTPHGLASAISWEILPALRGLLIREVEELLHLHKQSDIFMTCLFKARNSAKSMTW